MTKGERIRALRLQRDLTLEELGKMIGVGKATVKKYENGLIDNIPSDKIEALADALESTPAYIMGWTDASNETPHTKEARILAGGIDRLPQAQREQAIAVVRAMFAQYADFFKEGMDPDDT